MCLRSLTKDSDAIEVLRTKAWFQWADVGFQVGSLKKPQVQHPGKFP